MAFFGSGLSFMVTLLRGKGGFLEWDFGHKGSGLAQECVTFGDFLNKYIGTSSRAEMACELRVSCLRKLSMANCMVLVFGWRPLES